jgi:hypothetical protein
MRFLAHFAPDARFLGFARFLPPAGDHPEALAAGAVVDFEQE